MQETIKLLNERFKSIENFTCRNREDLDTEMNKLKEYYCELASQELLLTSLIAERDSLLPNSSDITNESINRATFIIESNNPMQVPINVTADYYDTLNGLINLYIGKDLVATFPNSYSIRKS